LEFLARFARSRIELDLVDEKIQCGVHVAMISRLDRLSKCLPCNTLKCQLGRPMSEGSAKNLDIRSRGGGNISARFFLFGLGETLF
jgi:hypothetical protein